MARKKTVGELVAALEGRPIALVSYSGSVVTKSRFRCLEDGCGHEWLATADNVIRGKRGCPACKPKKRMWRHDDLKAKFREMGFEDENQTYEGIKSHAKLRCLKPECGHVITPTYNQALTRETVCPECVRRTKGRTFNQMRETLIRRGIEIVEYAGVMDGPSKFRCRVDGHEWVTNMSDVIAGQGCKMCAGLIPLTEDTILSRLVGRPIELLHYARGRNNANSRFRCSNCSHEWRTTIGSVLSGSGCPACAGNIPYTVDEISHMAREKGLDLIRYGGNVNAKSHFKCIEDGFDLHSSWAVVRSAETPCPECGGRTTMPEEEVRRRLLQRDIELIEYGGRVSRKSKFRCMKDGHEWSVVTGAVLYTSGCARCAGTLRQTEKDVLSRLTDRPISLVTYGGSVMAASRWLCHECGNTWSAPADRILNSGTGCPECAETGFKASKPAHIYGYRLVVGGDAFFGFGITGDLEHRHYHHSRAAKEAGAVLERVFDYRADGRAVQALERRMKEVLPIRSCGVAGFIHEATIWDDGVVRNARMVAEELSRVFPPG